jgi:hypothetical protein
MYGPKVPSPSVDAAFPALRVADGFVVDLLLDKSTMNKLIAITTAKKTSVTLGRDFTSLTVIGSN